MNDCVFKIDIAGLTAEYTLSYNYTKNLLLHRYSESDNVPQIHICITSDELDKLYAYEPLISLPNTEYSFTPLYTALELLKYDRLLMHALAFVWRGKAWLVTAPSGTGKTTQYFRWKELYGEEVQILNGDKVALEVRDDSIIVHPTPWQGKEFIGQMISAPLGGIIYLTQEKENVFERISLKESILPILSQIIFCPASADTVHRVCRLEEKLLNTVPVWHLGNLGDAASAALTHDCLLKEVFNGEV